MTSALTAADLATWFSLGCKPRDQWRIGTEHEKIGFDMETLKPIPYEGERGIRRLLERLSGNSWEPVYEEGHIIALKNGMASITLEPGGQLELSGEPLESIHQTCAEASNHLNLLKIITNEMGIGFLGLGYQPKWRRDDIPWMPKGRYRIMRRYMPQVGGAGLDMMLRTATVQANLDFESEADMARKMRIAICLQPLVTALYAASPFEDGRPSGYLSQRAACWLDTDSRRTGIPACLFEDDFGFASYTEWALDAPMYFIIRDGNYIDCAGGSFREFMAGRLPQRPGERPTMDDWELHLSTLFPEVRLKQYLEMRGADAGPRAWICSLPALWKGLLYDPMAQDAAWAMVREWTCDEVSELRRQVPRLALQAPFRGGKAHELCAEMVDIAAAGLKRLNILDAHGNDESRHMTPLFETLASGRTQAEKWLAAWRGDWKENIDRIFFESMHP